MNKEVHNTLIKVGVAKLKVYTLDKAEEWDQIVKSFEKYDVHYLSNYTKAFQLHGDGVPRLFYFDNQQIRAINVVMQRDISESSHFHVLLPPRKYYDLITPFGYGGFLIEGDVTQKNLEELDEAYTQYCLNKNIVSEFVKFHPMLKNASAMQSLYNTTPVGSTVMMQLDSRSQIWDDLSSPRRRVIRKAIKQGVQVHWSSDVSLLETFIPLYNNTMAKDQATDYFYFDQTFYDCFLQDFKYNHLFFYTAFEGEVISMAMILFVNHQMHYFLSGSNPDFNHLSPASYVLYEAANWGMEHGYDTFHLGGGLPSLLKYKMGFNKHSNLSFEIGRKIFNQESYEYLVNIRKQKNDFDQETTFFPAYRS